MEQIKELKLEHLACYLPYKLKILKDGITYDLTPYLLMKEYDGSDIFYRWFVGMEAKPILKPLSGLESFLPKVMDRYNELNDFYTERIEFHTVGGFTLFGMREKDMFEPIELGMPYWAYQMVLAEHYDIYELIPAGLAIDYNTIIK